MVELGGRVVCFYHVKLASLSSLVQRGIVDGRGAMDSHMVGVLSGGVDGRLARGYVEVDQRLMKVTASEARG
jgi:hypothetical protein